MTLNGQSMPLEDAKVSIMAPGFINNADYQGAVASIDGTGTILTLTGDSPLFTAGDFDETTGVTGWPARPGSASDQAWVTNAHLSSTNRSVT